ncbi:MAG: hypothetical protein H7Z14_05880 [Anaerolineae bacterium]|nr:hypothetical protein [Phycisphaerae bacterium]
MPIDFNCQGCGKHYRVRDELAGRAAQCKNCGQKMVVPNPAAVDEPAGDQSPPDRGIGFADEEDSRPQPAQRPAREPEHESYDGSDQDADRESSWGSEEESSQSDEMGVGAEPDDGQRSMGDFNVKDDAPAPARTRRQRHTPLLPDIVGETVLPLAAIAICLGGAGFVAAKAALASTNPLIAFILMAIAAGLFFLVIVPLTLKGIEAVTQKLGIELANALKLQTVGLLAIPTGAMTFGYFESGVSGAINWGIFGLLVMGALIVLVYRADLIRAGLTTLWAWVCYALTAGLSIGVAAAVAWGMTRAGVRMPWVEKPAPAVVKADPDAEKKEAERKKTEEVALATEAEANRLKAEEAAKVVPTPPPVPAVTWTPIVDAPPPVRWPVDLKNQLIDVKPPVTLARTSPGSPFVAFVDSVALHVYDVRSGKRTGFIKDKVQVAGSLLSPDGTILIVNPRAAATGAPAAGGAPEFEVWSMPESRLSRKLTFDPSRPLPQMVGFDKDNRLITAVEIHGGKAMVQAWDVRSASPVHEVQGPSQLAKPQASALSAGGRFIACVADNRLNVFDLNTGTIVCDQETPHRDALVRAMSFSRDGSQLAAVMNENSKNHLIIFDNETGDVALDAELGGGARADLSSEQISWVPRGGALLIGNDWVDAATGRIIAILPPQTAGSSVGKAKAMISDSQVLVEFLPAASAQRVIYKGVSLNKKDIDAALAVRRAKTSNAPAPEAVADGPTTIPTGAPKDLIRAAVDHLAAGRNRDALAHAQVALDQLPKTPKVASDEQAIALHCLAVAYMRAGDLQKARDPLDRAASYTKTSRAITLNHAKLDIASQNFVVRAIRDLDKQLATNVDEETLNLMGLAINKARENPATAGQLKLLVEHYDGYNKKLEATKPGMRRWGNTWVSETELASAANPPEIVDEKSKAEERVKLAASDVERTRKAFADAKKQSLYDERKKDIPRDATRKNQPMYLSKAEDAYAAAQKEVEAAKLDLDAINARYPKPPFEENLEPVVPELELVAKSP